MRNPNDGATESPSIIFPTLSLSGLENSRKKREKDRETEVEIERERERGQQQNGKFKGAKEKTSGQLNRVAWFILYKPTCPVIMY